MNLPRGGGLLFLFASTICPAQVGRGITSIEGLVGVSKGVYVGKIETIERTGTHEELLPSYLDAQYRFRFLVSETIRGPESKTLEFVLGLGSTYDVQYLCDHHVELMLAIGPSRIACDPEQEAGVDKSTKPKESSLYCFRLLEPLPETNPVDHEINIDNDFGRMFGCDLKVVRGRKDILGRARAFAKKHKETMEPVLVGLPNDFFDLVGYHNAFGIVTLPRSEETERTLVAVLKNPGSFLSRIKSIDYRSDRNLFVYQSLKGLESFPSKKNERLVRGFATNYRVEGDGTGTGRYWPTDQMVMDVANDLLSKWAGQ